MRSLIVFLLLFHLPVMAADVQGSHDLPSVPRFAHAQIIDFSSQADAERVYPLSPLRRVSNQLRMEQSEEVVGQLTALTYELPRERKAREAFTEARKALLGNGAQPLFWCEGRECGSSSQWANAIFGNARLFGPDDQQDFLLVRLAEPSSESLVALYGITRGNRRAYLHVEQMDASSSIADLLPNPATLLRELKSSGLLRLQGLPVEPDARWVQVLVQAFKLDTTLPLSISGAGAEQWRSALLEGGLRESRLFLGTTSSAGLQFDIRR